MMFSAPVAVACALMQTSWSNPAENSMQGEFSRNCVVGQSVLATLDGQEGADFFDTSWLPSRGDFEMVADNQATETMWNSLGKAWLTPEQMQLLAMAYDIGYRDGGKTHARLVQAVLLQETIAGQLGRLGHLTAPLGKRSYGVMQVKVVAARDVLRKHPEFGSFNSDEQLITRLITDDEFNIRVASSYLKFLRRLTRSNHQALVAYNIGMHAARRVLDAAEFKYVRKVERYLAVVVKRYNHKFPNGEVARTARM